LDVVCVASVVGVAESGGVGAAAWMTVVLVGSVSGC
jgi:hypothetical protein